MNLFSLTMLNLLTAVNSRTQRKIVDFNTPKPREDCDDYVSIKPGKLNSECQAKCENTKDCVRSQETHCIDELMFGFSEGQAGVLDDYDNRWDNDAYWIQTMVEPPMIWGGPDIVQQTAIKCQELCQRDEGCGYFAYRSKGIYGDYEGPLCIMKSRDTVLKAIHKKIPFPDTSGEDEDWSFCDKSLAEYCHTHRDAIPKTCIECDDTPVCAYFQYDSPESDSSILSRHKPEKLNIYNSGPKYCGTDEWMTSYVECNYTDISTTTLPPIKTLPPHTEEVKPNPFPTQVPCWGQYDEMDLDFVHIQDFTGSYIKRREDIHADLTDVFDTLKDSFKSTKFTIVGANDKTHELSPDPEYEFECNDVLGESMDYNSSDYTHAMDEILNKSHYKYNYARPNIFDPLVDILNRWALEDATYDSAVVNKNIRMVSIATDQCSRVSGHYEKISSAIYEPWTKGERNIEFPLTGDGIATCQERDFPSVLEIAQELELRKVKIVVAVNPEMNDDGSVRTCQGYELFPHDVVSNLPVTEWWSKHVQEVFDDELVESYINTDSRLDGSMVPPILNGMIGILCPPYHSSTETV